MITFGNIKTKILKKLTELYNNKQFDDIKKIVSIIKEDTNFKKLFLFYEDMEKLHFDDKETSRLFIEEVSKLLSNKYSYVNETIKKLDNFIGDIEIEKNPLYESLDNLMIEDNLMNISKKVTSKKYLEEYLLNSNVKEELIPESFTTNENLLFTVLTNSYNNLYENILSDEEKLELKEILNMNSEDIANSIESLRKSVLSNIDTLLKENNDRELSEKLNKVKEEVSSITLTKHNYYRLKKFKENLI